MRGYPLNSHANRYDSGSIPGTISTLLYGFLCLSFPAAKVGGIWGSFGVLSIPRGMGIEIFFPNTPNKKEKKVTKKRKKRRTALIQFPPWIRAYEFTLEIRAGCAVGSPRLRLMDSFIGHLREIINCSIRLLSGYNSLWRAESLALSLPPFWSMGGRAPSAHREFILNLALLLLPKHFVKLRKWKRKVTWWPYRSR